MVVYMNKIILFAVTVIVFDMKIALFIINKQFPKENFRHRTSVTVNAL